MTGVGTDDEVRAERVAPRVAVRVTDDALRWIRSGHPWVFSDSILSTSEGGVVGDLAVVFDRKRKFQAIGLYDPASPIRVRILHHGKPLPIDDAWFAARIRASMARRGPLLHATESTGIRWVNGENDGLPGIVIDRYGSVAVVKLYTSAWIAFLDVVVATLVGSQPIETVVLRLSRNVQREAPDGFVDGMSLSGDLPMSPVQFRENGLVMEADVVAGQKTGYFLDQRDNRERVRSYCANARVLDVFCASGGFTVAAAAGGARSVCSVDISGPALDATKRNLAHNAQLVAVRNGRHHTRQGDAFSVLSELAAERKRFDVVVVDPPSFAHDQAGVPRALRAYARLTGLAIPLVTEGGLFVQASCSARVPSDVFYATVLSAAADAGVGLIEVGRTGHPIDHPIGFAQGAYLKALFATVRHRSRDT